jgi:hypothetical protein
VSDLSFVNNIAAGVDKLGLENTPILYTLALIKWDSVDDRDAVLDYIGGVNEQ